MAFYTSIRIVISVSFNFLYGRSIHKLVFSSISRSLIRITTLAKNFTLEFLSSVDGKNMLTRETSKTFLMKTLVFGHLDFFSRENFSQTSWTSLWIIWHCFDFTSVGWIHRQWSMSNCRITNFAIDFFIESNINLQFVIQGFAARFTGETFLVKRDSLFDDFFSLK